VHRKPYDNTSDWHNLYGRKEWKSLRASQLKLQPMCQFCIERSKIVPARIVDHIKPHKGDINLFHDPSNLQSLCKTCHDSAKQREEKSGVVPGCTETGIPIDSGHHWHE